MTGAFLTVTILTLGAALLVWLLQRLKLSTIIAYLALGVLVAPFKDRLFEDPSSVQALADLGVILLMFFIGIEFRLGEARSMLVICLGGGALQVLLTAGATGLLVWPRGSGLVESLVLGFMVAMSSTAIVMKAFEDRREGDSQRARMFVTVSLFQDIAAIFVVALLPLAAGLNGAAGGSQPQAGGMAGKLILLFVVLPLIFGAFRYLLPWLFEKAAMTRVPEAFSLMSLGGCLSVALAAHYAGASMALGAFLGGLVLAQTPFTSQIMADLGTFRNLALGFFFVSVGMLVDLDYVAGHLPSLLAGLVFIIVLKFVVALIALLIVRVPLAVAAGVALPLAQVGEFSFVLGQQADALGLLKTSRMQFLLALSLLSMLLAPFLAAWSGRVGTWLADRFSRGASKDKAPQPPAPPLAVEPSGDSAVAAPEPATPAVATSQPAPPEPASVSAAQTRAVVVGYGPVGKTLTRILMDFQIQPSVVDLNLETVKKLKNLGIESIFGDAGRREILEAAGIRHATYLLITLPDLAGRMPVVATARLLNPDLKILVRARYLGERPMLEDAGATGVSYEEAEVAVGLAEMLLREVGAKEDDIHREARRIRGEIALRSGFTVIIPRPLELRSLADKPPGMPPAEGLK